VKADVPDWALALLREARVARLGTADRGARPLVIPVCFAFDGRHVYTAIDAKPKRNRELRRLRNIAENPRSSLVVDHWDEDWTRLMWVLVEGRAEIITEGAERVRALELLLAKYPQYRDMDLARTAGPAIRIAPEHVRWWRWR
jgi:PPOX class probable F420-dependent enzyme